MNGAKLTVLIILLIVFLIFLLLCFKLKICVTYKKEEGSVYLKYLFFKFPLSFDKKEKTKDKKAKTKPKTKKEKKKLAFREQISKWLDIIASGGRILKLFLSLHKADITLRAKICDEDAAKTAISVGTAQAFVHTAVSVFANYTEVRKRDIIIVPDYKGEKTEYDLFISVYSRPIVLIFNLNKFLKELIIIGDALNKK